jgi:flagellar L-ring protein precursor FlgH
MTRILTGLAILIALAGCDRVGHIGKPPDLTPTRQGGEQLAMLDPGLPMETLNRAPLQEASLWRAGRRSLLGDRRAAQRGDILTVVIEIDEEAEISNATARRRTAAESLSIPDFLGLPQRIDDSLPDGASLDRAVAIDASGSSGGDGSVSRSEELTLRVAATVVEVLPNGILRISGTQEVRVNFELRELLVTGFVRPEDISRQNEITHDKIAAARISYGGRGQITDVQQPRIGQQVLDAILPF